jgi:hypothetical protein
MAGHTVKLRNFPSLGLLKLTMVGVGDAGHQLGLGYGVDLEPVVGGSAFEPSPKKLYSLVVM